MKTLLSRAERIENAVIFSGLVACLGTIALALLPSSFGKYVVFWTLASIFVVGIAAVLYRIASSEK
jgi:hypothetical protein